MRIKQFESWLNAKTEWQALEKKTNHSPFQMFSFQEIFSRHFSHPEDLILIGIYQDELLVAAGGFEKVGQKILFLGMKLVLGHEEVTDFGDILIDSQRVEVKSVWSMILDYLRKQNHYQLQLDYVREDSLTYQFFKNLESVKLSRQSVSPFINLPSSWDQYLLSLAGRDRRELRRKIKRLSEAQAFQSCRSESLKKDFADFVRLHQISDETKERFMSPKMQAFFWDLMNINNSLWQSELCFLSLKGKRLAAVIGAVFQNESGKNDVLAIRDFRARPDFA